VYPKHKNVLKEDYYIKQFTSVLISHIVMPNRYNRNVMYLMLLKK
jgi:hypothetical protein